GVKLSASGNQTYQELLIGDWNSLGQEWQKDFRGFAHGWSNVAQLRPSQSILYVVKARPRLLAILRTNDGSKSRRWFLSNYESIYDLTAEARRQQALVQQASAMLSMERDTIMHIIGNSGSTGHYNYTTGKYEW